MCETVDQACCLDVSQCLKEVEKRILYVLVCFTREKVECGKVAEASFWWTLSRHLVAIMDDVAHFISLIESSW